MSEWASIRLDGPPRLVAELVAQLGSAGLDIEQAAPVPHPAEVEGTWHAVIRPKGWGPPVKRKRRPRGRGVRHAGPPAPCVVEGIDGPRLLVAGARVAEVYERASAWAVEHGRVLAERVEAVEVESIRAVRYCLPHCGCGRETVHYQPCARTVRGAFRGAFIEVRAA
ncbi:hypothetical protein AB0I81_40020 [Nonomuraea sp. NPDC050404]|uniref:hypothetical protein n=1 Tax=Nonomuraea sp. NPDC050404 TaxID=3155783 RepID=UPI0033D644A3